ncbi:MAG: urea carboxylase-associated family protein [Amylibacter sp.]
MMSQQTYDPLQPDGYNDTIKKPISEDGIAVVGIRYIIPARQGRAVRLKQGQIIAIHNPKGNQVCDFFAIINGSESEFLSMEHSRTALGRIYVKEGDILVTNLRRPLIEIIEDRSPGVHDILMACCDHARYQQLGATEYHDNCADNLRMSLMAINSQVKHIPSPFNIWMNIPVTKESGEISWDPPVSSAGDYIRLKVYEDCIVIMTACPQDMTSVNGVGVQPCELEFELEAL